VPFEINTNDFHFDTEILLQAFHARANIQEFGIPTHYGSEICRVNGMRYAKDVILSTIQFKMHQWGMLCDLKYRRLDPMRYGEKVFMAYSSHAIALDLVRKHNPRTLLDIGCGPGYIARQCRAQGITVTGMDMSEPLPDTVDHFQQANLDTDPTPTDAFSYDMILMLDVIEHLSDPERFLVDLRNRSELTAAQKTPVMVLSTPNIAFAAMRLGLALGRFNYSERGILDITHKRLFTRKSLLHVLTECGYDVQEQLASGAPFAAVMHGRFQWLGRWLGTISGILARIWPSMFAFQFIFVCRPKPGVRQIIGWSEPHRMVNDTFRAILQGEAGRNMATSATGKEIA
jgi:2-polyprenyl-3-methyl-5-hydroxy-6-metoxy-1,4-benzoquinol methylase